MLLVEPAELQFGQLESIVFHGLEAEVLVGRAVVELEYGPLVVGRGQFVHVCVVDRRQRGPVGIAAVLRLDDPRVRVVVAIVCGFVARHEGIAFRGDGLRVVEFHPGVVAETITRGCIAVHQFLWAHFTLPAGFQPAINGRHFGDEVERREDFVRRIDDMLLAYGCPLHDIWPSGHNALGVFEVQVESAVFKARLVAVVCRLGVQLLDEGRCQRSCLRGIERQAERVPSAVAVEYASGDCHVSRVGISIADSRAVVGVVGQADGDGNHVACAVVEETVLVNLQHAVFLHLLAEDGQSDDGRGALRALCIAHRLSVVAVGDGGGGAAHESGSNANGCPARRFAADGGIERVADADGRAVVPAYEATTTVGAAVGQQVAVIHATLDVQRAA